MTDLYINIQAILNYQKTKEMIDVYITDSSVCTGVIQSFNGKTLKVGETEIAVADIEKIEVHIEGQEEKDLSKFYMVRVLVTMEGRQQIDGVCVSVPESASDKNGIIRIVTINGVEEISIGQIIKIVSDEYEVLFKEIIVEEENNIVDKNRLNIFETALISANKVAVENIITQDKMLSELGYTENEIEQIAKTYKNGNVSWGTDAYKTATRIYTMQGNKNGLAKIYYEKALGECKKDSQNFMKILNVLNQCALKESDEAYIDL